VLQPHQLVKRPAPQRFNMTLNRLQHSTAQHSTAQHTAQDCSAVVFTATHDKQCCRPV